MHNGKKGGGVAIVMAVKPPVNTKKAQEGGKTAGGKDTPISAFNEGEQEPVTLHGGEYVFEKEASTEMETLAADGRFEELGKFVAEKMVEYREKQITDEAEEEGMEEEVVLE